MDKDSNPPPPPPPPSPPTTPHHHTSGVFLPILQPNIRILLRSITEIDSTATTTNGTNLLQHVCNEINLSVTAALIGLSFTNARDVCLCCLASLFASRQTRRPPRASCFRSIVLSSDERITRALRYGTNSQTHVPRRTPCFRGRGLNYVYRHTVAPKQ